MMKIQCLPSLGDCVAYRLLVGQFRTDFISNLPTLEITVGDTNYVKNILNSYKAIDSKMFCLIEHFSCETY